MGVTSSLNKRRNENIALSLWPHVTSHAQTLDESLLQQAAPKHGMAWETGEPGAWNVWLDVDAGVVELFEPNDANNDIRRAAVLGHPEWNSNTLTNVATA